MDNITPLHKSLLDPILSKTVVPHNYPPQMGIEVLTGECGRRGCTETDCTKSRMYEKCDYWQNHAEKEGMVLKQV